ncbi:bacteriophage abortive infection AbiH family protein [Sphingobacterium sp. SG20118]|uniref:bacteriophage abortive infection AbiH family protein n=1 Tax=Sphingobacterium sp. SG20118 TaxID=3367156 RepID=UPI0037DFC81B
MKLYIIGNGFDISHGLPCRYSDFYKYLEANRPDVLEIMGKYYFTGQNSELWSDFERSLEEDIDYESFSTIISENTPNFSSDNFRDRDWYDAQLNMERASKELLDGIRSGFEEWIESLQTSEVGKKYNLDKEAYYLTFNYTELLKEVYRIPFSNVLHIHNKVGEELIFGHGKDLTDFNVREALYGDKNAFLSYDEDGNINSSEAGHEKFSEEAVETFYSNMAKNTSEIIKDKSDFFTKLTEVDEVIILGHSYNEIDVPYFEKVAESSSQNAKWTLSYFSNGDCQKAEKLMKIINVRPKSYQLLITSELILEDPQLKLFGNDDTASDLDQAI